MKNLLFLGFLFSLSLLISCKNEPNSSSEASQAGHKANQNQEQNTFKTYNQLDSADKILFDKTMAIHDSIMPKMSEIKRLQNTINPIFKDQKKKQIQGDSMTNEMRAAMSELNKAEHAMWEWMHDFDAQFDSIPKEMKKSFMNAQYSRIITVQNIMAEGTNIGNMVVKKYQLTDAKK